MSVSKMFLSFSLSVAAGLNLISATRHRSSIPRLVLIPIIFGEEDPEMNDSNGGVSACLHVCDDALSRRADGKLIET